MAIDYQKLRLDGLYQQDAEGHLMLRVKIPAGVLSSTQAETLSDLAETCSNGMLHLTSRGSIELHWLEHEQLAAIFRRLAAVGLSSRGACGGAVRGISCSTTLNPGFTAIQPVARRLNRHFAGNPHFEGLPKKFKIGVDAGYDGSRHLIQDLGLVHVATVDGEPCFDVWCAGGLGRQPLAGFLLAERVPEHRLIPLIEAVLQVYRDHTPPPKRLKHLRGEIGEEALRNLFRQELAQRPQPEARPTVEPALTEPPERILEVPVFAGELPAAALRLLAAAAREVAAGFLALSADQNVCLLLQEGHSGETVRHRLAAQGIPFDLLEQRVNFRVCPGNHECRMGLAPTRDIARRAIQAILESSRANPAGSTWAIAGCPNSCAQPQLADFGIVTARSMKTAAGDREPRFDLYRRQSPEELGGRVAQDLSLIDLITAIGNLT